MIIYQDTRFEKVGLIGGTLDRVYGNMCEIDNQNAIFKNFNLPTDRILHFKQTHSDTIIPILSEQEALNFQKASTIEADAWVMNCTNWGCAIQTADCVPLFLWDEDSTLFALAHCGWRGVAKQLPYKVASTMEKMGAKKICAWVGPHIQSCCFEVQEDVATQFPVYTHKKVMGKTFVNLNEEILRQLTSASVQAPDILFSTDCTACDEEHFFSWRRDHIRRNLLSFLYRK